MKKLIVSSCIFALCGCVDTGRVGMHPEMETAYIDGHPAKVEKCLSGAALAQRYTLVKDDPLPDGSKRFNLEDTNSEVVAWVESSAFNDQQTMVQFYYAPNAPEVQSAISTMISQCKNVLY